MCVWRAARPSSTASRIHAISASSSAWKGGTWPSAVGEARAKVDAAVKLSMGYKFDWGGEYKEYLHRGNR